MNIVSEDKAQDLFDIFYKASKNNRGVAIECALICCDEILNIDVWEYPHNAEYGRLFWLQVKQEILSF